MTRNQTGIAGSTRAAFVVTGALLAFALSPAGPDAWRETPSLRWLHLVLAYGVLSAAFAAYTILHAVGTRLTVQVGCYLGLLLYGIGLVALLVTLRFDRATNPIAIAAAALSVVLHYAAGRNATIHGTRR